jgi:TonB family protein
MTALKPTFCIVALLAYSIVQAQPGASAEAGLTVTATGDTLYSVVDSNPEFKGGHEAWSAYVSKNLTYPGKARRSGLGGEVYTSFVVTKDGRVIDVKTIKGISPECDAAARKVIERSPLWIPGSLGGKAVNVRFVQVIEFKPATGEVKAKRSAENRLVDALLPESREWSEGSILLKDGTELKGVLKYNDKTSLLSFSKGDESHAFIARKVAGFEFYDEGMQKQRVFYTFPYEDTSNGTVQDQFFEVLKEFKSFAVLSKPERVSLDIKSNPGMINPTTGMYMGGGRGYQQLTQVETIYIMDASSKIMPYIKIIEKETYGNFFDSSKTKNKTVDDDLLEKYTGEHYGQLESYARENKLRFNKKEDLMLILNYYAQLVKLGQ